MKDISKAKAVTTSLFGMLQSINKIGDEIATLKVAIRDTPKDTATLVDRLAIKAAIPIYNLNISKVEALEIARTALRETLKAGNDWLNAEKVGADKKYITSLDYHLDTLKSNAYRSSSAATGVQDVAVPQLDSKGIERKRYGLNPRDMFGSIEEFSNTENDWKPRNGWERYQEITVELNNQIFARNLIMRNGCDARDAFEGRPEDFEYSLSKAELKVMGKIGHKNGILTLASADPRGIDYSNISQVTDVISKALYEKFPYGVYNITSTAIASLVAGTNSQSGRLNPTVEMVDLVCRLTDRLRSINGRANWFTPYKSNKTTHAKYNEEVKQLGKRK